MKRRELIAFASGVLIYPSVSSLAQALPKAVRLGILQASPREDADKLSGEPFLRELAKLGYVEGQKFDRRAPICGRQSRTSAGTCG